MKALGETLSFLIIVFILAFAIDPEGTSQHIVEIINIFQEGLGKDCY